MPRRVPRAHHENDLARNFNQGASLVGDQQGRRIQQHDTARVRMTESRDDLPHAVAAQEFRSGLDAFSGRQERQAAHVRLHHQRLDVRGFVDQCIQQASFLLHAHYLADMLLGHIAVHQQHGDVAFERHAQRKIDAGKGLAVTR